MPDVRRRKILLAAGLLGVLFTCAGLVLVVQARTYADYAPGRWLLILAWLILVPLFVYLIRLRSTARQTARRRALARKRALDAPAAAARPPDGMPATGQADPPGGETV